MGELLLSLQHEGHIVIATERHLQSALLSAGLEYVNCGLMQKGVASSGTTTFSFAPGHDMLECLNHGVK